MKVIVKRVISHEPNIYRNNLFASSIGKSIHFRNKTHTHICTVLYYYTSHMFLIDVRVKCSIFNATHVFSCIGKPKAEIFI